MYAPKSFFKISIMQLPKPEKNSIRKRNFKPLSLTIIDARKFPKYLQTEPAMHEQNNNANDNDNNNNVL